MKNETTDSKIESEPIVSEDALSAVPPQYRDLPADVVEELWQHPTYVDKNFDAKVLTERTRGLEALRAKELQTATEENTDLNRRLDSFRQGGSDTSAASEKIVADFVSPLLSSDFSPAEVPGLSSYEINVLGKMAEMYKDAKAKNPNSPVQFRFANPANKLIYENLVARRALEAVKNDRIAQDAALRQQAINEAEALATPSASPERTKSQENNKENGDRKAYEVISKALEKQIAKSTKPEALKSIRGEYKKWLDSKDSYHLAGRAFESAYAELRKADYSETPEEQQAYQAAMDFVTKQNEQSKDILSLSKFQSGWVFRGYIPEQQATQEKTVTRGSMNVRISPELLHELDDLIKSGVVKMNYKFGDGQTPGTEPKERHDTISLYFIDQEPSEEAIKALSKVATKHLRGDKLLGKKISEGFYMSEIGSVSDQHIPALIDELKKFDPDLAKAAQVYTTRQNGKPGMSEGQYYAVKDILTAYGVEMEYDIDKGFRVNLPK